MDKLREAMETAIKAHWDDFVSPEPALAEHGPVSESTLQAASAGPARPASAPGQGRSRHVPRVVPLPDPRSWRPRIVPVSAEAFARNRLVAAIPGSPEREAYCLLQAAVVQRLTEDIRVIGVTGPRGGAGKTLTAANLAISLAVDAHREVLLIDLDLKAPAVHKLFGAAPEAGIEDCLFNGLALPDALFSPPLDRVAVLPARGGSRSVAQVLRSPSLKGLLDTVRARYAQCITVIDLPAVANRSDAAAFEALVDGVVLVVEDGVTREADYRRVLQSFGRPKLIGTVLNKAEPS
jgi:Mrp family chromosome partitioning ATPase